jgi:hypothetical protein
LVDRTAINELVERALTTVADLAVIELVRKLRVEPYPVEREWNYGAPGQKYVCWTFFEHPESNTGIAYCEHGFGPEYPWGLVAIRGPYMSMGMSDGWFPSLDQAVRESMAWEV